MKAILKILAAGCFLALLASCAPTKEVTSPEGVDAGTQGTTDTGGATARGYDSGGGLVGQSGVGPSSPFAERVVYFDYDSAEIRADSRPIVEAHALYLVNNPSAAAILEGHTDERGTREYNIGLGERRSASVRRLMIAQGVALSQIQLVSFGEERPAVAGQDEGAFSQNRRVEISY